MNDETTSSQRPIGFFHAYVSDNIFLFITIYYYFVCDKRCIEWKRNVFGLLLLFSIVGSRLFCGWLCPGGAVQDYISGANSLHWNSNGKNLSKYIIWVVIRRLNAGRAFKLEEILR